MATNHADLGLLSAFLDKTPKFIERFCTLRSRPFLDLKKTAASNSSEFLSREDAAKPISKRRKRFWSRLVLILAATLCLLGIAVSVLSFLSLNSFGVTKDAVALNPVTTIKDVKALIREFQVTAAKQRAPEYTAANQTSDEADKPPQSAGNASNGVIWICIVLLAVFIACVIVEFKFFEIAAHVPDPLFGRLLQARFQEAKPYSARFIAKLLSDERFALVLKRATNLILFPIDEQTVELADRALKAQQNLETAEANYAKATDELKIEEAKKGDVDSANNAKHKAEDDMEDAAEDVKESQELLLARLSEFAAWNSLKNWLRDEVSEDEVFLKLVADRTVAEPKEIVDSDGAIEAYLFETIRRSLFKAVVDDPDLLYIYDDMTDWPSLLGKWLAKIDFAKAKDLFGKQAEKGSPHGADIQGIANVTLIALIIVTLAGLIPRGPSNTSGNNEDIKSLREEAAKIEAAIEGYIDWEKQNQPKTPCPPAVPVNITSPPAPPANVTVAPPAINFPSKLTIDSGVPAINVPSELTINLKSDSTVIKPNTPPSENCCTKPNGAEPKPVDDTLLRFPTANKSQKNQFPVKIGNGSSCIYSAELLWQDSRSPLPLAVRITAPKLKLSVVDQAKVDQAKKIQDAKDQAKNGPSPIDSAKTSQDATDQAALDAAKELTCPYEDGADIPASQKPIYNTSLHAYFSVEEGHHSIWPPKKFGKEIVILRIHPQDAP